MTTTSPTTARARPRPPAGSPARRGPAALARRFLILLHRPAIVPPRARFRGRLGSGVTS